MKSYMTPDEYFLKNLNTYTFLFLKGSEYLSRLQVMEHMFVVLGNGIDKQDFLRNPVKNKRKMFKLNRDFFTKKMFYVYDTSKYLGLPSDGKIEGIYTEEQLESSGVHKLKHVIVREIGGGPVSDNLPDYYPNFSKEYSFIHKMNFFEFMGEAGETETRFLWLMEAEKFFIKAKEFFSDETYYKNHMGFIDVKNHKDKDFYDRLMSNRESFLNYRYVTEENVDTFLSAEDFINYFNQMCVKENVEYIDSVLEEIRKILYVEVVGFGVMK